MKGLPPPSKKGIRVLQGTVALRMERPREKEGFDSELRSLHSSRSKGISMSRESGINLDRIYDAKHFLPPKPTEKIQGDKRREGEGRTLLSYKSLGVIKFEEEGERKENHE